MNKLKGCVLLSIPHCLFRCLSMFNVYPEWRIAYIHFEIVYLWYTLVYHFSHTHILHILLIISHSSDFFPSVYYRQQFISKADFDTMSIFACTCVCVFYRVCVKTKQRNWYKKQWMLPVASPSIFCLHTVGGWDQKWLRTPHSPSSRASLSSLPVPCPDHAYLFLDLYIVHKPLRPSASVPFRPSHTIPFPLLFFLRISHIK